MRLQKLAVAGIVHLSYDITIQTDAADCVRRRVGYILHRNNACIAAMNKEEQDRIDIVSKLERMRS